MEFFLPADVVGSQNVDYTDAISNSNISEERNACMHKPTKDSSESGKPKHTHDT